MKIHSLSWLRIVVGFLLVVAGPISRAETIEIAVFEYPPFLAETAIDYGLEPAIVTAAFKRVNVGVKYTFLPAARALTVTAKGNFQATLGWVKTDERERDFYYSDPIAEAPLVFFHLKSVPFDWKTYDDLKGVLIGTVNKYNYGDGFDAALEVGNIQVDVAGRDESNFRKLLLGRNTITPVNLYVGYNLIHKNFDAATVDRFTHHPLPLKISVHHLLFPKGQPESSSRLEVFNQGLQKIKASGEYKMILEKHLIKIQKSDFHW